MLLRNFARSSRWATNDALREEEAVRTAFIGSFPPRECGIATFTADLIREYDAQARVPSEIIAIDESALVERKYEDRIVARIVRDDKLSYRSAAHLLNASLADLIHVQHEYGLFGGDCGSMLLEFFETVRLPVILTLHTVLPKPSAAMRSVTRELIERASATIVLAETARALLVERYGSAPSQVAVVPHGVPSIDFAPTEGAKAALGLGGRTLMSTFGFVSRGKGLEHAISAMHRIVARDSKALYLILGQTHPLVRASEGESYRAELQAAIDVRGLHDHVSFVDRYLPYAELLAYLRATDIYVTPYLNSDQIVSGTLAYAIGCGKPIVSTPYLYAREMLGDGRGMIVPFADAEALADAVLCYSLDPCLRLEHARATYALGRQMTWPYVARRYQEISRLVRGRTGPRPPSWTLASMGELVAANVRGTPIVAYD